jgi:hypothetical protein
MAWGCAGACWAVQVISEVKRPPERIWPATNPQEHGARNEILTLCPVFSVANSSLPRRIRPSLTAGGQ